MVVDLKDGGDDGSDEDSGGGAETDWGGGFYDQLFEIVIIK